MRALLFDLDGTLTDPRDGIVGSLRHALAQLGVAIPSTAVLEGHIGPPLEESFAALLGADARSPRVDRAIFHYRERFAARGWRENRVIPGVPELLAAARTRGARCLVATSKPTVFARRIVAHFGLDAWIDGVYGSELDGRRGAKPELIAHLLSREALAPDGAVMIGDRRHDVEGARSNGVAAIGVLWGYGSRAELESAGADRVCADPSELLELLEAWSSLAGS